MNTQDFPNTTIQTPRMGAIGRACRPAVLASWLVLTACSDDAMVTRQADLLGTWRTDIAATPSPDGSASAFLRRELVFSEDAETLRVEAFANPEASMALFTYASSGPYTVIGEAPGIEGALALDLINEFSEVTIFVDAPDLWQAIGLGNCPLAMGEAVDISKCVSGPPFQVSDCVDMDVVKVDRGGHRLRFGAPGTDRCEVRPITLDPEAYTRVE